jgi:erythromycin esterase-like protein
VQFTPCRLLYLGLLQEFYRIRAEVTKLLIQERGFAAVVAEADFPDAFRVNM